MKVNQCFVAEFAARFTLVSRMTYFSTLTVETTCSYKTLADCHWTTWRYISKGNANLPTMTDTLVEYENDLDDRFSVTMKHSEQLGAHVSGLPNYG
jgi:hypothetical protein